MNRSIVELKQERAGLVEEMQAIFNSAKSESRSKTEVEELRWTELDSKVKDIDSKIAEEERMEDLNKSISKKQKTTMAENTTQPRFNLFKAILEHTEQRLTGLEKEMHDEGIKELAEAGIVSRGLILPSMLLSRTVTTGGAGGTTSGAAALSVGQDPSFSIVAPQPLYRELGTTVYEGLVGKFDLPSVAYHVADFVAETIDLTTAMNAPGKATLDPRRIGVSDVFTKEFLAQTNSALQAQILGEFQTAIDRGLTQELLKVVGTLTALSGYAAADDDLVMSWADFVAMEAAIEAAGDAKYVMPRSLMGGAKTTSKDDGSGRFIWEANQINGYSAFATSLFPSADAKHIIFGDFSKAAIGLWGALEIITNPYSYAKSGKVEITVNRLADVTVRNSSGFAVVKNAIATAPGGGYA